MNKTWLQLSSLLVRWYLGGLLAWTLWAPSKVVLLFWNLGKPFCQLCFKLPLFISLGMIFGFLCFATSDRDGKLRSLRASPLLCTLLTIALALPSLLILPRPYQLFLLSAVLAFDLFPVVKSRVFVKSSWRTRICLALGITLVYGLFSLWSWRNFYYPAYDTGIFFQAIWHLSDGRLPSSSIKGLPNLWGDHFHPVLLFFVPFYWILGFPGVLIAQALVIGLGVIGTIALTEQITRSSRWGVVYGLCFAFFFGFQESLAFGFYPEIIVPTALTFALWALVTNNARIYGLSILLALMGKENVSLYLIFLGFLVWLRQQKKWGAVTFGLGISWFFLTTRCLIPHLSHQSYAYFPSLAWTELLNPLIVYRRLSFPAIKLETLVVSLASFGFLPLFSPANLVPVIPMFLERFLPNVLNRWTSKFHYSPPLIPFLVLAAAYGSSVLKERVQPKITINSDHFLAILVMVSTLTITVFDHRPLARWLSGEAQSRPKVSTSFLSRLPREDSLSTSNALVPWLANREFIYALPNGLDSNYIIIGESLENWPLNQDSLKYLETELRNKGYSLIYRDRELQVLANPR